ncbi:MAG: KEOPS complex subunit Pcc1 [Candidatus Altiarchaeota archaeon]
MRINAVLSTESKDAGAVADAVKVDNVPMDGLLVSSSACGSLVETRIQCASVETLLGTLDDLLRCQMASEELM